MVSWNVLLEKCTNIKNIFHIQDSWNLKFVLINLWWLEADYLEFYALSLYVNNST